MLNPRVQGTLKMSQCKLLVSLVLQSLRRHLDGSAPIMRPKHSQIQSSLFREMRFRHRRGPGEMATPTSDNNGRNLGQFSFLKRAVTFPPRMLSWYWPSKRSGCPLSLWRWSWRDGPGRQRFRRPRPCQPARWASPPCDSAHLKHLNLSRPLAQSRDQRLQCIFHICRVWFSLRNGLKDNACAYINAIRWVQTAGKALINSSNGLQMALRGCHRKRGSRTWFQFCPWSEFILIKKKQGGGTGQSEKAT